MLEYRPALAADAGALADLRLEFMRIVKDGGIPGEPVLRAELVARFASDIEAGRLACWLCLDGARAVGASGLGLPGRARGAGLVHNMYTVPAYRRRGIGAELLRLALEGGRARGVERFRLQATEDGLGLYERAGFKRAGRGAEMRLEVGAAGAPSSSAGPPRP